jgi:predicted dienelactone hydrolase
LLRSTRKTSRKIRTVGAMRPPAIWKHPVGLVPLVMLLGVAVTADERPSSKVAYRRIDVQDAATGELFPVALWYPTLAAPASIFVTGSLSACRLPAILCQGISFEMQAARNASPADGKFGLIVISHGAGGLSLNHRDLATALASNGYVVAAPTHPRAPGNDISGIGVWLARPGQVSRVIDAVLEDKALGPHVDEERIGAVGHSNGGYTALALAGARPNPQAIIAHCRQHSDDRKFCSYGGAATREATRNVDDIPNLRDPRVRAIVLMAPNAAPFADDALARVDVPVRVYGAERDDLTLVRYHAERLARALPPQTEYRLIKGAGHFSFIASFPWALRVVVGEAARDPEGFDRDAMHSLMNPEIVLFFNRKLPPRQNTPDTETKPTPSRGPRDPRGARIADGMRVLQWPRTSRFNGPGAFDARTSAAHRGRSAHWRNASV